MGLRGSVRALSLDDLLGILGASGHEGSLVVHHQDDKRTLYLYQGGIYVERSQWSFRLGDALVRKGEITHEQLDEALELGVDVVLLDNMDAETLREAVGRARGRSLTEASGGIRPEGVREVAETGVDIISLGWLTHSAPSLDVALDIVG